MKTSKIHISVMLFSAIATLSPIPEEFKIVTGLNGGIVGGHLAFIERENRKKKISNEKKKESELQLRELQIEDRESNLDVDVADLDRIKSQHQLELEAQREKQLTQLSTLEANFTLELADKREKMLRDANTEIENLKHTLKLKNNQESKLLYESWVSGCDRLYDYASELMKLAESCEYENGQARLRLARRFKGLRSRLFTRYTRKFEDMDLQFESSASQLNEYLQKLAVEKVEEMTAVVNRSGDNQIEEIASNEELLTNLVTEKFAELTEQFKRDIEEHNKAFYQFVMESVAEFNEVSDRNLALKEEIEYLRGKLNNELKPGLIKKPRHDGDRKTNDFLNWIFDNWGIVAEHNSSLMSGDRVLTVNFDLIKDQDSLSKKIKRLNSKDLPVQLQAYFGCESEPIIGMNNELGCWVITIPPTQGGSTPRLDDSKFAPATIGRSPSFDSIESALREQIELRASYEQMEQFMLGFTPVVPVPMPVEREPNNQELNTLRWFFLWRSTASNGRLADIVSIDGLMREVYGVNSGDFVIAGTNETLTQRIDRLMQQLRLEMVDLQ